MIQHGKFPRARCLMGDPVICAAIVARGIMGLIRNAVFALSRKSVLFYVFWAAARARKEVAPVV